MLKIEQLSVVIEDKEILQDVNLNIGILSDFKSGKRDSAEFWINLKENKVYIRYMGVFS
jgi:DUF438 domain-containing protein